MLLKTSYKMKPPISVRPAASVLSRLSCAGLWLFNERSGTKCFDSSGYGNRGVFAAADPPRWKADYINFDTGVERIVVPHKSIIDFATEGFSITVCFRTPHTDYHTMISKNYGGAGVKWYTIVINAGNVSFGIDDGVASVWTTSILDFNDGKWHTATGVRNTTTGKIEIYVDGTLAQVPTDDTAGSIANTGDLYIGCRADLGPTRDYIGDLKFVYIHRRVLYASDVRLLYKEPFCMFKRRPRWLSIIKQDGLG